MRLTDSALGAPEDLSPGVLRSALARAGIDGAESIDDVRLSPVPRPGNESAAALVTVSCRDPAVGAVPRRLFLKISCPSDGTDEGTEARFYATVGPRIGSPPMVRCFDAAYDGTRSHLILDDLSESHGRLQLGPQNRPAETETARLQAVARAYARVHAATWGRWQLGWRPGRCFLTEHEIVGEPAPAALLELVPACHGNPRLELRPERLSALMTAVELCRSDRSRILCVRQGLETVW